MSEPKQTSQSPGIVSVVAKEISNNIWFKLPAAMSLLAAVQGSLPVLRMLSSILRKFSDVSSAFWLILERSIGHAIPLQTYNSILTFIVLAVVPLLAANLSKAPTVASFFGRLMPQRLANELAVIVITFGVSIIYYATHAYSLFELAGMDQNLLTAFIFVASMTAVLYLLTAPFVLILRARGVERLAIIPVSNQTISMLVVSVIGTLLLVRGLVSNGAQASDIPLVLVLAGFYFLAIRRIRSGMPIVTIVLLGLLIFIAGGIVEFGEAVLSEAGVAEFAES